MHKRLEQSGKRSFQVKALDQNVLIVIKAEDALAVFPRFPIRIFLCSCSASVHDE